MRAAFIFLLQCDVEIMACAEADGRRDRWPVIGDGIAVRTCVHAFPGMGIRDGANDDRPMTIRRIDIRLTTLRDATDVLTQQDLGRTMSAKLLLRKSTTAAWIAMIATELHQENDANTLDWFPPGSM